MIIHEIDYYKTVNFEFQEIGHRLVALGHKVFVIDYESKWDKSGSLISKHQEIDIACADSESSVKLIRPSFIKIPVLSRVSAWFTYWDTIERVIRDKNIDVIILYSVPTNGLQTIRIAQAYGIPVVFRSMDVLHKLVKSIPLSKITYLLEKKIYSEVDLILVNSPKLMDYVISMGASSNRTKYLPTGIDIRTFSPYGDSNENRIVFIGTLYKFSGLDYFIKRFPEILSAVPDAKLLIVGDGEQRTELENIIIELGLSDNISITGYKPFSTMPSYINSASVCIIPFLVNEITKDIGPVKVFQYLSCGKPVVASSLQGLKEIVYGEGQGMVYGKNMDDMIVQTISLLKSPERRNVLGQAGMKYIKENHDYDKVILQWERELSGLIR